MPTLREMYHVLMVNRILTSTYGIGNADCGSITPPPSIPAPALPSGPALQLISEHLRIQDRRCRDQRSLVWSVSRLGGKKEASIHAEMEYKRHRQRGNAGALYGEPVDRGLGICFRR